ncbi:MAG: sigma factor [Verrucomicrobiae bacterium]|nr:sigma factor [Verrucomicrobiae bacterium]
MSVLSLRRETQWKRADFPATHWSTVLTAGEEESSRVSGALERICEKYWYPLYAFVRRKGYPHAEAQDLTQQFLLHLLEKNSIRRARQERGKFRSFLLTSLNHFLADDWKRQSAQKRGGGQVISLDGLAEAEMRFQQEDGGEMRPDKAFEKAWAMTLLEKAMIRLRREWAEDGKETLFDLLKEFILAGPNLPPYRHLGGKCRMTEGALKMAVCRMRRQFREILCDEMGQTVEHPGEIEEEIRYFIKVMTEG